MVKSKLVFQVCVTLLAAACDHEGDRSMTPASRTTTSDVSQSASDSPDTPYGSTETTTGSALPYENTSGTGTTGGGGWSGGGSSGGISGGRAQFSGFPGSGGRADGAPTGDTAGVGGSMGGIGGRAR